MKLNLKIGSITVEDLKVEGIEISEDYSLEEIEGCVKVVKEIVDYLPEAAKKISESISNAKEYLDSDEEAEDYIKKTAKKIADDWSIEKMQTESNVSNTPWENNSQDR